MCICFVGSGQIIQHVAFNETATINPINTFDGFQLSPRPFMSFLPPRGRLPSSRFGFVFIPGRSEEGGFEELSEVLLTRFFNFSSSACMLLIWLSSAGTCCFDAWFSSQSAINTALTTIGVFSRSSNDIGKPGCVSINSVYLLSNFSSTVDPRLFSDHLTLFD